MYESITKGRAPALKIIIRNTDKARKVNLSLLRPQLKSLNFSENSSSGATSKKEKRIVIPISTAGVKTQVLKESGRNTNEVRKIALAGVGGVTRLVIFII